MAGTRSVAALLLIAVPCFCSELVELPQQSQRPHSPPPPPPPSRAPLPHYHVTPPLSPLAGVYLDQDADGDEGRCARDSAILQEAATNRTLWAIRMIDASEHLPSGMLVGKRYQLGSFDGCLSADSTSPVGSRYCLVKLKQGLGHASSSRPSRRPAPRKWETIEDLTPDQDVADILNGEGMMFGSLPMGEIRVGLCVPRSCVAPVLQTALQASLDLGLDLGLDAHVTVLPEYCYDLPAEAETPWTWTTFFCALLGGLTALSIVGPALGWSSWNWREHVRSLSIPDPPLAGIDLTVLSGLRAINAILTVSIHRGLVSGRTAISNQDFYTAQNRCKMEMAMFYRGGLYIETFFVLAGLQVALGAGKTSFLKSLLNRIARVLPVYGLVLLFYVTAFPEVGSGPLWREVVDTMSSNCKTWGWTNLMFVNNYLPSALCMEHGWYMAVDTQLFVVSSLLMVWLPAGLSGLMILAGLTLLSTVPMIAATLLEGLPGTPQWTLKTMQNLAEDPMILEGYIPSHLRATPYLVGVFVGRALPMLKSAGFRPGATVSLVVTLLSVAGLQVVMSASSVFNDLTVDHSPIVAALCAGLCPFVWAVIIGVLIVVLALGEQTIVRSLLSWQPLVTLSRLTFAAYLVSYPLQVAITISVRDAVRITVPTIFRDALSDIVLAFSISFWLFIILEAPLRLMAKKALSLRKDSVQLASKSPKEGKREMNEKAEKAVGKAE